MSYFTHTGLDLRNAAKVYFADLSDEIYQWAQAKGFEPAPARTFGDECALLTSEVSEAFEAYRRWGFDDATGPDGKPEGVHSEFGDVQIRLLHYSKVHNVDLLDEVHRKMAYNWTRAYRHGDKRL